MATPPRPVIWLAAGVRTPFARVDGALAGLDAIELSVPVVQHMLKELDGGLPDFMIWGTVVPNLAYSNIAREVLMELSSAPGASEPMRARERPFARMDAGAPASIPAFSTVMACSTSMMAAIEASGMLNGTDHTLALVGGAESLSRIQLGLGQSLSDWIRRFTKARSLGEKVSHVTDLRLGDVKLYIPSVTNRTTGKSMGEHTEITAREWKVPRDEQDQIALASHRRAVAAREHGFFDDLVVAVRDTKSDTIPRRDTSIEKLGQLAPAFDRASGQGTLTAGNSSPLTDGAAGLWVATTEGLSKLPQRVPRVRLVDWEASAVDLRSEGLLMAPAYGIPRLLVRNGLTYDDIDLWEIHEAFAAQIAAHLRALDSEAFLRDKAGVTAALGRVPRERINPNGGSIALGHPFGATGARILSQAVKELAARPAGTRAIVSICADGGLGTVTLLESGPGTINAPAP